MARTTEPPPEPVVVPVPEWVTTMTTAVKANMDVNAVMSITHVPSEQRFLEPVTCGGKQR